MKKARQQAKKRAWGKEFPDVEPGIQTVNAGGGELSNESSSSHKRVRVSEQIASLKEVDEAPPNAPVDGGRKAGADSMPLPDKQVLDRVPKPQACTIF